MSVKYQILNSKQNPSSKSQTRMFGISDLRFVSNLEIRIL